MTVLGAQLVFSMVIFSFLQKLACFYSFGRWLLAGRLLRYLHPSDEELKKAAGIPVGGSKAARNRKAAASNKQEPFTIPRSTPIQLDTAKVEATDLIHLHYYSEYIWLMDFSICTVMVYVLTEVYYTFGHWNEMNISFLWCHLAIGFCLRILLSHTKLYFQGDDGGERILILTFGFLSLVLAMAVLVVDENIIEFGLQSGYENFSASAVTFLEKQGIDSEGPVNFLTFRIILAFVCALIGALLTFPGLRMAKLHLDALKYSQESPVKQMLLHLNFILPVLILLLWVKPIGRDMLCGHYWRLTTRVFSDSVFESFRIVMFVLLCVLRLAFLPIHLQAHLNSAYIKVENIRRESGRISNVEVQKTVARVFYFVAVVTLQYLIPVLLLLFMALLYKTLGNFSWSAMLGEPVEDYVTVLAGVPSLQNATASNATTEESIVDKAVQFSLAFSNLREVFTPLWYRGILSFLMWWVCAAWSISTGFGLYYHTSLS